MKELTLKENTFQVELKIDRPVEHFENLNQILEKYPNFVGIDRIYYGFSMIYRDNTL